MLSLKTVLVILVTLIFCSCKEQSKENAMQDTIAYKGNDTTVQKSDTIKPKDIKVVKLEVKGKNEFIIRDISKSYLTEIKIDNCDTGGCEGKAEITLIDKSTNEVFQKFSSDQMHFSFVKNENPKIKIIELHGAQSPVIINDFNFDGYEDIAFQNGNESGYGGPSYDAYLFNEKQNKFIKNKQLSELARAGMGMFETDSKRKRLSQSNKSGCCWHQTIEYGLRKNKLIEVYKLTEESIEGEPGMEYVLVTTEQRTSGKWKKTEKKYKASEYYK